MAVQEQFLPTRKAFSAERSKDIYESQSSDSGLEEIGNRTFKVCSSASMSARERRHAQKNFEYSMQEEFSPRFHKVHNKENQKLFLQASQILEKLNKLSSNVESQKSALAIRNTKMKTIAIYHDKLQQLLIERSSLLLMEESFTAIKRTTKCIEDFKHIYYSEKLKMTTMPMQAFNRFISSSDINISSIELLIKKLNNVCDMHSSLTNNYQNLINLFHGGANIDLNKTISKSCNVLNSLETDVFYWSHKYMGVFMQKVCLADPNSVSQDFLLKILRATHVYNSLLKKAKNSQCKLLTTDYIFCKFILSQKENIVSFNLILQNLSFFEAKVAAERIVNNLSSNCKKHKQTDLKRNQMHEIQENETSEFSPNKNHDCLEQSKMKNTSPSHTSNFATMLLAIIQRNQSLILKYMYSITSLEGLTVSRRRTFDSLTPTSSARQMWDLPQLYNTDDNYTLLEEVYWSNFWSNIRKFVLKLLFNVPYHQYGDSAIGTIMLWPDSFIKIVSETFKISINNKDFSMEGRCIIKQLYDCLIIHQGKLLWDKEFSLSLPAIQSHLYTVITTSKKQLRTYSGNSLHKCLCVLVSNCSENIQEMDLMTYLPVFLHLQAVIDSYISWVNVKSRALIASQNLSTLLLIYSSDCNDASQLLKSKVVPVITEFSSSTSVKRLHPSVIPFLKNLINQVDIICNFAAEVPTILHKFCMSAVTETLMFLIRSAKVWQKCVVNQEFNFYFDSIMDFLSPMTEVVRQLEDAGPIILSITSGVCQGFLAVLHSMKRKLRLKKVQILLIEHTKFLQWLEGLNLSQSDLNCIKKSAYFEKLYCLLNFLLKLLNKPKCSLTRQNRITPAQPEEVPLQNILTKDDIAQWEEKCSQPFCFTCM
nr:uncharacterized protein LOC107437884 isoform X1 [Parasteatoda tepidariorum]XP_042897484.1 uncharacterized protein LOC107437884 isoform X2 [Parasteatoda tepidariorum]